MHLLFYLTYLYFIFLKNYTDHIFMTITVYCLKIKYTPLRKNIEFIDIVSLKIFSFPVIKTLDVIIYRSNISLNNKRKITFAVPTTQVSYEILFSALKFIPNVSRERRSEDILEYVLLIGLK